VDAAHLRTMRGLEVDGDAVRVHQSTSVSATCPIRSCTVNRRLKTRTSR
jgi:hypothetical protein